MRHRSIRFSGFSETLVESEALVERSLRQAGRRVTRGARQLAFPAS
jgi:hypothetical protein